jgi:hypothetical protein
MVLRMIIQLRKNADKEFDHGMSSVKSAYPELLQQFHIMMPEKTNMLLLAERYLINLRMETVQRQLRLL